MAFTVREISIGRRNDRLGISFPYSKSRISNDVRLLERGTAAAIIPRHLRGGRRMRISLRELREGVRLRYEIETQHRRKDGTCSRSTRTFEPLASAGKISERFSR